MAEFDRTVPFYQEVEGCVLAGGFSPEAFKSGIKYVPRDDDFFISTYPKCGTTWTQQIVYLIYNRGEPAEDAVDFFRRTPYLEMFGRESGEQMPRPGAIKVHLPFHLTPYSDKAKYLYVVRNPKDVCVSYFHHMITDPAYTFQEGTLERYFEDFIVGKSAYNDYFDHVLGWYEHRDDPNVMIITYEEMKKDTKNMVLNIAKFMGEEWFDMLQNEEGVLENVLKYSKMDFMKTQLNDIMGLFSSKKESLYPGFLHLLNFKVNHSKDTDEKFTLVRKGLTGGWRDVLSEEQVARLDERIEKELRNTDVYTYWKSIGCI